MRLRAVISLLYATLVAGGALAETVIVNDQLSVRDSSIPRPKRGMHMTAVERQFGAPTTKHEAVGRPPITRWDYPAYSVFFERDIVIHTVVAGDQPPPSGDHAAAGATP